MFRETFDRRIEKRLEAIIEPHIEQWLHRFFLSSEGQSLIAEVTADFLLSWLTPGTAPATGSYFQNTLLQVIRQLSETDPDFRQAVIAVLNPHWTPDHGADPHSGL